MMMARILEQEFDDDNGRAGVEEEQDMMVDGDGRWSCCNDSQTLFLLFYLAYIALALVTWNTLLAKPMRMIAVFIHEWSHAVMCWLTCGYVRSIEVHTNEGGVTRYAGGCRMMIIPAGYLGCSFTAMVFIILSGGRLTSTVAAAVFSFSLLFTICFGPNKALKYLCLSYSIITVGLIFVDWYVYTPILQFLIQFYGVFLGMYSIHDSWCDCVARTVQGSDAYSCSQEVWPCCSPKLIGLMWTLLGILMQLFGTWMALLQMSEECEDLRWMQCLSLSIDGDLDMFERNWDFEGFWEEQDTKQMWEDARRQWGNNDP